MQRRKKSHRGIMYVLVAAIILGAGLAAGRLMAAPAAPVALAPPAPSIAGVVEGVWDAVVPVLTQSQERTRRGERSVEGSGSAVLIDDRGLLLTNAHVVEGALSVSIQVRGGAPIPILNIASDQDYDLAVMDAGDAMAGIAPVPLGGSSPPRVGDIALVLGYPSSGEDILGESLTVGYISGLNRNDMVAENLPSSYGLIQTDAAINGGNSGGALLSGDGRLVGVPTLKLQSGYGMSFEGLAFAIPVSDTLDVIGGLMDQVLSLRQKG